MKKTLLMACITAAALTTTAAVPAFAEDGGAEQHEREHKGPKADTDGDGVISKSEFMAEAKKRAEKHFEKLDTDKSGDLSREEMKEGFQKMRKHKEKGDKREGASE